MLRLSIFGTFGVADASGNEVPIKSRKARALLAYLALPPGKPRSRERIMALLWSDRGDRQARSSLRQALSGLRKDLGDEGLSALRITDESLTLDPARVVVEPAAPGDVLLDGLHLTDPAFEEWLRDERLRLEDAAAPDKTRPELSLSDKPSIAVLPFVNMSGDPEQEYFSDGITEDIITELSRFREFTVIARDSTFQYKGRSPTANELARELAVRYIVRGSIRRVGDSVRVTAQLIDATSSTQIWAERYDRHLEDVFAIQDELTASVVARVDDRVKRMGSVAVRLRNNPKPASYDLVLRAYPYRTQFNPASMAQAGDLLERAIEIDPDCVPAFAALAFVRASQLEEGWSSDPDASLREAQQAAKRAVTLDNSDGYAHASMAYVSCLTSDYEKAVHEAGIALKLNPNDVHVIMTHAWVSIVSGNPGTAIELIERARRLNPNMPGFELWTLGSAYLEARRYQEAIDAFSKLLDPPMNAHLEMAVCYAHLRQEQHARDCLATFLDHAKNELSSFPRDNPAAWRKHFERTHLRKRVEDVEHFIEGARMAGLPV